MSSPLPNPNPECPVVTRMISNSLLPNSEGKDEAITWVLGQPHPLSPDTVVVRMFIDRGGVEVYSKPHDNRLGVRTLIPMSCVRLVEEAMPFHVFVEELTAAEQDDDDDPDGDAFGEPEPASGAPQPTPALTPSNGQPTP